MNPFPPQTLDFFIPVTRITGFHPAPSFSITSSSVEMEASVASVEKIINYSFRNKRLLEEALTHSSFSNFPSYERLEFIGDAVLGLAISNHLFLAYPNLDPDDQRRFRCKCSKPVLNQCLNYQTSSGDALFCWESKTLDFPTRIFAAYLSHAVAFTACPMKIHFGIIFSLPIFP